VRGNGEQEDNPHIVLRYLDKHLLTARQLLEHFAIRRVRFQQVFQKVPSRAIKGPHQQKDFLSWPWCNKKMKYFTKKLLQYVYVQYFLFCLFLLFR
jgi:hypothetical protein